MGIASAVGVISVTVFGTGVAAADAYAGKTYSDASSAIGQAGKKAVIVGTVGFVLPTAECIVTRSQSASWLKGDNFKPVTDTVLLYLNCNQILAAAGVPGNSAASPEGQAAKKEQVAEQWKATTPDGAAWCAANEKAHPDWGPAAFKGCPS